MNIMILNRQKLFLGCLFSMILLLSLFLPGFPADPVDQRTSAVSLIEAPYLVKDIVPGSGSSYPDFLIDLNGTLYFLVEDGNYIRNPWKSDGTEAGTIQVTDFCDFEGCG